MKKYSFLLILVFSAKILFADEGSKSRPDSHAPIGVMADHAHNAGEVMLSYRYMVMNMNQNYTGSSKTSVNDIVAPNGQFAVAPENMQMQMHMIGVMYAPIDALTIMAMMPFVATTMEHKIAKPVANIAGVNSFNTSTSGIGDLKLGVLHPLMSTMSQAIVASIVVSVPTGSINESAVVPVPPPAKERTLPYPMQLGSGSVDIMPSLTYTMKTDNFSVGFQGKGVIPLKKNEAGYMLGKRLHLTSWFSYLVTNWLSTSVRVEWQKWGNLTGVDSRIAQKPPTGPPKTVPTAQPDLRAGDRIDVFLGVNLYTQKGPGKDQRLALEFGYSAYQDLDGPQLGSEYTIIVGWQSLMFTF